MFEQAWRGAVPLVGVSNASSYVLLRGWWDMGSRK